MREKKIREIASLFLLVVASIFGFLAWVDSEFARKSSVEQLRDAVGIIRIDLREQGRDIKDILKAVK